MLGVFGKNNYAKAQLFKKIITKKNNIVKFLELLLRKMQKGHNKKHYLVEYFKNYYISKKTNLV